MRGEGGGGEYHVSDGHNKDVCDDVRRGGDVM